MPRKYLLLIESNDCGLPGSKIDFLIAFGHLNDGMIFSILLLSGVPLYPAASENKRLFYKINKLNRKLISPGQTCPVLRYKTMAALFARHSE